jgi:signal transduction histidine kinase
MTASSLPPAQRRAPLSSLAALALTCCLAAYVIVVPLLVHRGAVGWRLGAVIAVGAVAAVVVLVLLAQLRRAAVAADAMLRGEVVRLSAETRLQQEQLRRLADQVNAQDAKTTWQAAELSAKSAQLSEQSAQLSEQSAQLSEYRETEPQLRAERDRLRQSSDGFQAQLEAVRRAMEHTARERVPAAMAGAEIPEALTDGVDAELAKMLDEAVESGAAILDQQDSMRSAVVALARRVQASAHRIQEEATLMADRHPGDADVLEVSMRVDHAAAQQARNAQSMAVLCGEWPGQQWPEPLPLVDVVRAAAGRIIAYRRIEVAGDPDIAVAAPVVEPVIHLVAELLANATQSSPPATQVPVTVRAVQRGAVIEIHDCGVGLDDYRLTRARDVASGITLVGLSELGEFPQTGLAVVGQYVRRHGFRVDMSESVYGGVRAVVGVPAELVETVEPAEATTAPSPVPESRPAEPAPSATSATAMAALRAGLPRRQSPRHTAVEATGTTPAAETPAAEQNPATPEQAGAWMGAFLNDTVPDNPVLDSTVLGEPAMADDNSTEQQER